MELLAYILKANLFLVIFYGFYFVFFRKETFHKANRYFLVAGAMLALVLPFVKSSKMQKPELVSAEIQALANDLYFQSEELVVSPIVETYSYLDIFQWLYLVGLIVTGLVFLVKILKTFFWLKSNKNANGTAFSFLGKIFIDNHLELRSVIFRHEDIHVKQKHFLDLIFFEMLQIIFWFNPVIYFYKKSIAIIHEFLADEEASKIAQDKIAYASLLVSKQFSIQPATVFTQHFFNHSTLKSRIIMLSKNPSKKTALLKFGLLAPAFFVMLAISSFTIVDNPKLENVLTKLEEQPLKVEEITHIDSPKSEIKSDTTKPSQIEEIFTTVDQNPEYPGGMSAMYRYLGQNIIYPGKAQKANIQGKVHVKFVIKSDGKIDNINIVKSVSPELDNEAMRVVQNMPDWHPAIQNGKSVSVYYNLPISFKLEERERKELEGKELVVVGYSPEETSQQSVESKKPSMIGLNRDNKTEAQIQFKGNTTYSEKGLIFVNDIEILDKKMDFISPNSIESVSVLRSEEAIKAYGPRAKDGVILIKTKTNFIKTNEKK
ncbi:M56 family metallopeptidase [Lacihabitans soyangensis]|uniref:TonB family protein n=1 Tax=Lacihabitans soyangensis TaxID=869394 RepID=A0AAE3KW37_9BACT|nr:TonB family protein [Lacihabitans soyangensis]MCP9762235.1 TonB family protein [Lacihabitans soyangensis]